LILSFCTSISALRWVFLLFIYFGRVSSRSFCLWQSKRGFNVIGDLWVCQQPHIKRLSTTWLVPCTKQIPILNNHTFCRMHSKYLWGPYFDNLLILGLYPIHNTQLLIGISQLQKT
jgi:hypothetical protein